MAKLTLQQLGGLARRKRGDGKLRETAHEIGVSSATLSRVERGHLPDLGTFAKLCRWLKVDPGEVLGFEAGGSKAESEVVSAHFRADRTMDPELADALAKMIVVAHKMLSDDET